MTISDQPAAEGLKSAASGISVLFPGVTMATKGKRKHSLLCLAVILFFVSHFARTAESFRLSKTEKSTAAADFKPGRIVFGNISDKTSGVDVPVEDGAHISPSSTEGDVDYQGDYPGLQTHIPGNMKFMNPSVLCGLNKMKFMAQGADAQQFSMDPGASGLPVPLPNVPSTCGYDTQWNSPSLSMVVPYNGCFMIITGGYYVLPMLWYNIQFSLWCPMSSWGLPPPMQAAATTTPPVSQPFWNVPFQMPQHVKHPPWSLPSGQMPPQAMPFPKHPPWIDPSGQIMPFPKHPPWNNPSGQIMPFPKHPPWNNPSGQIMPFPNLPFPKHPPWIDPSGQIMPFPNPPSWNSYFYPTTTPKTTTTPPSQPSPGGQVPFNPMQLPHPWGFPMFPPGGAFPVKPKPNQPIPPFGPGYPLPIQCSTCVSKM